jgi:hypothetical protein
MKSAIAPILPALALLFAAGGASATACTRPAENDAVEATKVVQDFLKVPDFTADMCRENGWMILQWRAGKGYGPGQALLRYTIAGWTLVRKTDGSLKNVELLESLGVSASTATAIANDIK